MRRTILRTMLSIAMLVGLVVSGRGVAVADNEPGAAWKEPVTGMEFVWVPPGCFMMGSESGNADERPVHEVCLDGFWLGKYEVTQDEWGALIGARKSHLTRGKKFPVEGVSWEDTETYITNLNARSPHKFRLPSEAEWEYACRYGGTAQTYCGGSDPEPIAWYRSSRGNMFTTNAVGSKEPNALGLFDMSGNVGEWVWDWYDAGYYAKSAKQNPKGPAKGASHVLRGGSWINMVDRVRATARAKGRSKSLNLRLTITGFRLVHEKPR